MIKSIKTILAFFFILSQQALGCWGEDTQYRVNFKYGTVEEGLIIILTNPDNKNDTKIVSDDTGYISAYLGALFLIKKAGNTSLSHSDRNVIFIKNRIKKLNSSLNNFLEPYEKRELAPVMDDLLKYFDNDQIDRTILFDKFLSMGSFLSKFKVVITGRIKTRIDEKWSSDTALGDLKLPTHHIYRGGCNSSIGDFSSVIGNATAPNDREMQNENLPVFDFASQ